MTLTHHPSARVRALHAGAGRGIIDFDGVLPHDGFTTVVDELAVRALVLDGSDGRVVLTVVDITSIPARTLSLLKKAVATAVETTSDRVIVVASHTFSAPHIHPDDHPATATQHARNDEYEQRVVDAALMAALQAAKHQRPARVETATGACNIAVNRDVETPEGWTLGADVHGPTDQQVSVLAIRTDDATPLAVLVNYAVQPAAMNGAQAADGGLFVSGDIAGALTNRIEQLLPGSTAFFLPGAGGDQAPVAPEKLASLEPLTTVGSASQALAAEVLRVLPLATPSLDHSSARVDRANITVRGQHALPRQQIKPTRDHQFTAGELRDVPIAVLHLGDARLLCVQPELSVNTGRAIKDATRGMPTFIVTMADGAAKYMPEASAYPRFTYEALSSAYAQGSAEKLAEAAVEMLSPGHRAAQHA